MSKLCGALCVRRSFTLADWLDDVLPDADAQDARYAPLGALYAHTVESWWRRFVFGRSAPWAGATSHSSREMM